MKKINIFMLMFSLAFILAGCNVAMTFSEKIISLDTAIDINFTASSKGKEHLKNIKNIYKQIDKYSDNYNSSNDGQSIKDLNDKREIQLNDTLKPLLEEAIRLKNDTNGYYNPLIGKLSTLWKAQIKNNKILDSATVAEQLEIMNNSELVFEDDKVKIVGDADVDLGGIAKGYATELVHKYLLENNITNYKINAGDSNILVGKKNKDSDFRVGLSKPFDDKTLYGVISVKDISIATSSPKYQSCNIDGVLYHHILSPFTGMPINNYESINVICDDSMIADVYSTALFSMNLDYLKEFVDKKNVQVVVCKNNEIIYQKVNVEIEKV